MRASIEVKDYSGAEQARQRSGSHRFAIGDQARGPRCLRGRLAEGLGHDKDALDEYKIAAEIGGSGRRRWKAGLLPDCTVLQKRGEIDRAEALRQLETLSMMWRGRRDLR